MAREIVGIVTIAGDWHARKLAASLLALNVDARIVELPSGGAIEGIQHINGLDESSCIFIRHLRRTLVERLPCWDDTASGDALPLTINSLRAIASCCNKAETSATLKRASVPTPDFWVPENSTHTRDIISRETASGSHLVLKPLRGSQGYGLRLFDGRSPYEPIDHNEPYYLQRFVENGAHGMHQDYRVFVIGGYAIAGMTRSSGSWVCNAAQGALCRPLDLSEDIKTLAEESASAMNLDVAGVDIVRAANDELLTLEINAMPAWSALQSVVNIDIARSIARHIIARMSGATSANIVTQDLPGSYTQATVAPI